MREDCFVNTPRYEENISNLVASVREKARISGWWKINMVSFIETILPKIRFKSKLNSREWIANPKIIIIPETHSKKAYVRFKPKFELNVRESVWEAAKIGDPEATFILAHELGHIIMHKEETKGFLATPELRQKHSIEHSAEWQADTFAKHFLLPDNILIAMLDRYNNDAQRVADESSVPLYWVLERIAELRETGRRKERSQLSSIREQDLERNLLCPHCGQPAIPQNSPNGPCEECKKTVIENGDRNI